MIRALDRFRASFSRQRNPRAPNRLMTHANFLGDGPIGPVWIGPDSQCGALEWARRWSIGRGLALEDLRDRPDAQHLLHGHGGRGLHERLKTAARMRRSEGLQVPEQRVAQLIGDVPRGKDLHGAPQQANGPPSRLGNFRETLCRAVVHLAPVGQTKCLILFV
jgi:hypothetical protein